MSKYFGPNGDDGNENDESVEDGAWEVTTEDGGDYIGEDVSVLDSPSDWG